jgi:hypothetical protein
MAGFQMSTEGWTRKSRNGSATARRGAAFDSRKTPFRERGTAHHDRRNVRGGDEMDSSVKTSII